MSENNFLYYSDDYVYFSFQDIHSKDKNVFIQNSADDLKYFVNTGAEIEFTSPKYQTGQQILGVTHPQRSIPLHMAGYNLTRQDISKIMKWLKPGNVGAFSFDFSCDWVYDVVVKSISDPILYSNRDGTFIIDFEIEFVTINSAYARNKFDGIYTISLEEKADNSLEPVLNGEGAYNNNLIVPCILCNTPNHPDSDKSKIQCTFKIIHIGNSGADFVIAIETDNPLNANDIIQLDILKLDYINFFTHFDAAITENGSRLIIEYRSNSNTYFINGNLLEQSKLENFIHDLHTTYNYSPLELTSMRSLEKIVGVTEAKNFLDNYNNSNRFICVPGTLVNSAAYGEEDYNDSLYPSGLSTEAVFFFSSADDGFQNYTEDTIFYAGFYDEITIMWSTNCPTFELKVRQYTEVI